MRARLQWILVLSKARFLYSIAFLKKMSNLNDENGSRYVHCGNQGKTFLDSTFAQGDFYIRCNASKAAPAGDIEPKFFAAGFHSYLLYKFYCLLILLDPCMLRKFRLAQLNFQ